MSWLAKHYLRQWQGYIELSSELTEWDQKAATVFFNALKQVDEADVKLLSDKYVTHIKRRVISQQYGKPFSAEPGTDKAMADLYGIEPYEYRQRRVEAEARLETQIKGITGVYNEKQIAKLPEFNLKMGKLYLKSYEPSFLGIIRDEVVFTLDPSKAKIFKQGDEVAAEFMRSLNLEKCEVDRNSVGMSLIVDCKLF